MTIDLNTLTSPENSKRYAEILLRAELRARNSADESGWISSEQLYDLLGEEVSKSLPEAERATAVEVLQDLMLLKNVAVSEFSGPIIKCHRDIKLSIKDTVFVVLFAAANFNVASELTEQNPHLDLHSKEDFLKIASIAYDYMLLHFKSMLKSSGKHPPHDH